MLAAQQTEFLRKAYQAAKPVHIFPGAAAAEAALESGWGTSGLCTRANNLFGMKKPHNWTGPTISLPTREYIDEKWVTVMAVWPVFESWSACMTERMNTLKRVPRYAEALQATTPEDFIIDVSFKWATDPYRAKNVLSIYQKHISLLKG